MERVYALKRAYGLVSVDVKVGHVLDRDDRLALRRQEVVMLVTGTYSSCIQYMFNID